jgi:Lamin Tail Domain
MRRFLIGMMIGGVMTAGAVVAAPGAQAAAPAVRIVKVQYDSPGTDTRSNASLNAEWVALRNMTGAGVSVAGWTLRDAQNHVYALGSLTIAARATVYVHTGRGTNSTAHRYWGSGNYIWNNTNDAATLRDRANRTIATCAWKTGPGSITC